MGKTSIAVRQRYIEKTYDSVAIRIPKGDRDRWKEYAERHGMSLAGMIKSLVEEEMKSGK